MSVPHFLCFYRYINRVAPSNSFGGVFFLIGWKVCNLKAAGSKEVD